MNAFKSSGLEFVDDLVVRGSDRGIWGTFGIRAVAASEGDVTLELVTDDGLANHGGILHGGICAMLLDEAMALAIHSTMPPGYTATTIDLTTSYQRAGSIAGHTIRATGLVTHRGSRIAMASGSVVDERGKTLATATMSSLVRNIAAEVAERRRERTDG